MATTTVEPSTLAALANAIGLVARGIPHLPADAGEQDRLLASAIRDHRADTPIPPEPEPGRTTVQREPRLLVRQASTRLAGLDADLREAKRRRDEFAALVKKTGG